MITSLLLLLLLLAVVIRLNVEHHRHLDPHAFTRNATLDHPAEGFGRHSL